MALNLEKQLLMARTTTIRYRNLSKRPTTESNSLALLGQHRHPHHLRAHTAAHWLPLRTPQAAAYIYKRWPNETKGTNTPALPLPTWLTIPNLPANAGTIACLTYSTLYILMEPVAGGILAPLLLGGTAFANHLTATHGMTANYIAIGVHIASWLAQFVGHGVYEGRAPALLDNLVQAIFLAPFFVWMEILFAFGYRPELKSRLDQSVEKELEKLKAEKAAKVGMNGSAKTNGHAH
ncbi:hypothetical protein LTR53_013496 [Teratosphaeriaceae sp. CCFEE 6253]|nr:hypothetical protein LTR53_013496 [Teratosphaeriaceae sp. CCFEE 6253]